MEEKLNEEEMIYEERPITYKDLERVNKTIVTTDIKGKNYAEVNQRIKAFRMLYPQGLIETEMVSNENGMCIFRAKVYGDTLLATGTAYEKEGSTFINKTSYIENCETSAIGRALGIAGFGIDTSIASAEEVLNAVANQETEEAKATPKQIEMLCKILSDEEVAKTYEFYKIGDLSELTIQQASSLISKKKGNK